MKDPDEPRGLDLTPPQFCEEGFDARSVVMAHDLCQKEVGRRTRVGEKPGLFFSRAKRIGPAAELQRRNVLTNALPQQIGMGKTPRPAHAGVAPEHRQGVEALRLRPLGIEQTVFEGVLARQKRHHPPAGYVVIEVAGQMSEVFFFGLSDRIVGEKEVAAVERETADGPIEINPRIDGAPAQDAALP